MDQAEALPKESFRWLGAADEGGSVLDGALAREGRLVILAADRSRVGHEDLLLDVVAALGRELDVAEVGRVALHLQHLRMTGEIGDARRALELNLEGDRFVPGMRHGDVFDGGILAFCDDERQHEGFSLQSCATR